MNLQNNISFSELSDILDNQLTNSFTPHVDAIPNVQSKGIYFWFMKQSAYKALKNSRNNILSKLFLAFINNH